MPNEHVRAKCTTTGAIASLPEKALDRGHIRNWVRADGPAPARNKPAWPPRQVEYTFADGESASEEGE